MRECDLTDEITQIKAPALLLMGTEGVAGDEVMIQEIAHVEKHIDVVEKVYIEGSGGTYYMIDSPEKTADAITDWLERYKVS